MRYLIVLSTLAVALCASATASAGGWATVGIDPLPDGVEAGGTWKPNITILAHGRTPLDGLVPTVTISEDDGTTHRVSATPAGEAGVYEASVVFSKAGTWHVVVDSTYGESRLTYGPVAVEDDGAPVVGGGRSLPRAWIAAIVAVVLLLVAVAIGTRRFRRLTPASR